MRNNTSRYITLRYDNQSFIGCYVQLCASICRHLIGRPAHALSHRHVDALLLASGEAA